MKTKLPLRFVVSKKPKEYLKQGLGHCSVYSVKAVLSAYGLDDKRYPKEYHRNWLGRFTGISLGKYYLEKILREYGINAETNTAKSLSDYKKIKLLEKTISNNTPVMIRIGNWYVMIKNKLN